MKLMLSARHSPITSPADRELVTFKKRKQLVGVNMGSSGNPAKREAQAAKKKGGPTPPKKSAKAPVPLQTKNPKNIKANAKTKSTQRISNFRAK